VRGASAYLDYFVRDAHAQREYLDGEFVRENVYMVEGVALLSLCDVTMLQYLPWKKSRFFVVSDGYPSQSLMQTTLLIKTVESFVTVTCEILYLELYSNVADNPLKSPEAEALFYMNIVIGVITVVVDLLMLCMRGEILRSVETEGTGNKMLPRRSSFFELMDLFSTPADTESGSGYGVSKSLYDSSELTVTINPMLSCAAAAGDGSSADGVQPLPHSESAEATGDSGDLSSPPPSLPSPCGIEHPLDREEGVHATPPAPMTMESVLSRHRLSIRIEGGYEGNVDDI
jgi:hypothetical protein